ncbi:hypothetical protein BJF89_13985 [Corynebacterium sp. CNJ-954]|uniref:tape measure protein n=1 Tax=Corynebacterium sp. CNJ-954 TaxID=1904962 RepID=UPI00096463E2|nr:tape measure protein [Corynebacterium sp. CNJ-954]OLT55888.1 hypothetical protein BJF89_13985 [Corynebacterium sp. CNJ-954]
MAELGVGYISIVPEVSKISPGIAKALKGAEGAADSSGQSMGGKISSALGGALKKGAVGTGVAAGGILATSITKGLGRLNSIEQAEAKLKGLGNSTQQVGSIMENALASVNGTAFGLEEAATTAGSLVAAGIKPGQELEGVLTTVADTATIAGRSMSDMGLIFGSVAAKGKLQGDDMLQLLAGGIPVLQLLADETGKTSAEISDMVSNGEVDFALFERAMKRGMGGAALEAGNTVEGAFKNMGAALGRFGATLAGPFFTQAAGAFGGVTEWVDKLNTSMKPVMEKVGTWLEGTAIPALKRFGSDGASAVKQLWTELQNRGVIDGTVDAFKQLWSAGKSLAPAVVSIGKSLAQASAAVGVSTWTAFVAVLQAAGAVAEALAGPLQTVAGFMEDHPKIVAAAVAAWAGFKTLPGIAAKLSTSIGGLTPRMSEMATGFSNMKQGAKDVQAYYAATGREVSRFGATMVYASGSSNTAVAGMGKAFVNAGGTASGFGSTLKGLSGAAMSGVASGAKGIIGALGGPWGAAMAGAGIAVGLIADYMQKWNTYQEASNTLTTIGTSAYKDMFQAIASGGDVMAKMSEQVDTVRTALDNMGHSNDGPGMWANRWSSALGALSGQVQNIPRALNQLNFDKTADDAGLAAEAIENLGMSNEELSTKITGSAGNWSAFKARLQESGEGGERAAQSLQKLRDAHTSANAEVERLGPAAANAASVLQELATTTGDAADRASKLRQAFMELRGVEVSATEAASDLTNEVQNIEQKMDSATGETSEFAGAMLKANGQIDATTPAGAALYDTLDSLGDSMQRSVASGNDANQVFGQSKDALEQMRQQAGIGVEDWNKLLQVMGMTPEEMKIVADVQADAAKADLAAISNQIKGLGDGAANKPIPIKINDEEAKTKLEQAGFKLDNWDAKTGTADLDLTDAGALERYNWWMSAGFPAIDMSNPTAKANLDNSGLLYNKDYAMMQLATLDLERPMPWASMNISSLSAQQLSALQKVGLLDGQKPTPDAFMNISQLSKEQQTALAKVFNLDAQTPTPVADLNKSQLDAKKGQADGQIKNLDGQRANPRADLNNDGVRDGTSEAKMWIAGILGKTVTITFRAIYEGFKDKLGLGDHSTGGYFTGPAYASGGRHGGYRLPTSGPGTEVTDGFLAFDKNNVPAARLDAGEWIINSRSSKKYHKELREINNGTYQKLPGYASGGVAHADDIDKFARGIEGKPYVWGGVNWGDCSGAMSAIARFAVGLAPFAGRFATGNEGDALRSMGFTMGRGSAGDLRFGWYNGGEGGGHTSGTLPNGVNVEMGGGRGNGQYGGPAAGAWHSQYTDHAFLRVPTSYKVSGVEGADGYGSPGDKTYGTPDSDAYDESVPSMERYNSSSSTSSGTESDAPTSWSDVAGRAGEAFAKGQAQNALSVFGIPDTPPILAARKQWEEERRKAAEQAKQEAEQSRSDIDGQVSNVSESGQTSASQAPPNLDMPDNINRNIEIAYNPNGGAEQWRTTVEMSLKRVGMALSNTNRTIEQIDIESGGDPNAQNNWDINAQNGNPSIGLLQVIKTTFQAHRDKGLPDDQRHPLANVVAALNYTKARYGGPSSIWPTRAGYRDGGEVRGPGGRRADRIPAWLSATEHVINASSAIANRDLLSAINAGFDAEQVMSDLIGANEELRVAADGGDWGYGSLSNLLGDQRGRAAANLAGDLGETSRQVRDEVVVNNNFTAATPDAMYRMYRREASRSHGGRIGAR